jgi:AcrR family transcriptional regulator
VKSTQTGVFGKRARGKAEMEERILATTDRLFYGQGIRAIGVDTIAAETGISKRTLYNYFTSKDALIAAYL